MDKRSCCQAASRKAATGTSGIPNRHLAVYGLFVLGGDTKYVHTEDTALKCFELFQHSFSWVKHPEYPDKDIVRIALCDARKDKYGGLVEGRAGRGPSVHDGWRLTAAGVEWIKNHKEQIEGFAASGIMKEHRQKVLRDLKRVKYHRLYGEYLDSGDSFSPQIGDIAELMRCRVDAEEEIWEQRFQAIERKAETSEQKEVGEFIALCRKAYLRQRL
ncbi:MAG: hypothetical protein JXN61_17210 [Sedimentisphaerales bacterium]|nr:hypothetical protein [Sedimentisphaerales bacterium]